MHTLSRSSAVLGVIGCLTACAPAIVFTKTTSVDAQPRAATCALDILTTRPDRAFDELGVIDIEFSSSARPVTTAAEFRKATQPQACAAGGDAVLAEVNGFGAYVRGTVIRYRTATAANTTP